MIGDPGELRIESISFGERWVEVAYSDPRKQGPRMCKVVTQAIDPGLFPEELGELLVSALAFLERALLEERNPPERIAPARSTSAD